MVYSSCSSSFVDGFMDCGCVGDSDQRVSVGGFLLFCSKWNIVYLHGVCLHGCICWVCSIPYFTRDYSLYNWLVETKWFANHKYSKLIIHSYKIPCRLHKAAKYVAKDIFRLFVFSKDLNAYRF